MEIKHYLNNTEINEPIGFDKLKMQMKRHDYHGMSAEVSEQTLEFYGNAINMIVSSYEDNIDTELVYSVHYGDEEVYRGVLDLSTFEELQGEYHSVSCKVGEIGPKTTFNNRTRIEVAINGDKGIYGNNIIAPKIQTTSIEPIPIIYSNIWKSNNILLYGEKKPVHNFQPIFKTVLNEFGEHKLGDKDELIQPSGLIPIFATEDGYSPYDVELTMTIDIRELDNKIDYLTLWMTSGNKQVSEVIATDIQYSGYQSNVSLKLTGCTSDLKINFSGRGIDEDTGQDEYGNPIYTTASTYIRIDILAGATIKVRYTSEKKDIDVQPKCIFVNDVLDCVSQKISGIRVVSDWYKIDLSNNIYGGGGLRAITNGYCLRNADGYLMFSRPMKMSFKDAIEALSAIDCIGYGFEQQDGKTVVRVERWQYFYKDEIVMQITNPNEIKRTTSTDYMCSNFEIGYQKYVSVDEINAIDSVHSEYSFVSNLKAVENTIEAKSKWIADQYAIELTRRQAEDPTSADWKYDENIFILEVWRCRTTMSSPFTNIVVAGGEEIDGMLVDKILNPSLSVRRNAERWADYLFFANKTTSISFTSGTGNYNAAYKNNSRSGIAILYRPTDTNGDVIYETSSNKTELAKIKENDIISQKQRLFKAETIEFTYPLTIAEYKAIKANPYGLIQVNGILGWIKEFSYTFITGEANFVLIPKA